MHQKISDRISEQFVSKGIIPEEDKEIYAYGWRALGMWALCTATMFGIGFVLGELYYTVVFFIFFSMIRAFYDGYHTNSRVICFISSTLLFIAGVFIKKYVIIHISYEILRVTIGMLYIGANAIRFREYQKRQKQDKMPAWEKKKFSNGIIVMTVSILIFAVMLKGRFETGYAAIYISILFAIILFCVKRLASLFGGIGFISRGREV